MQIRGEGCCWSRTVAESTLVENFRGFRRFCPGGFWEGVCTQSRCVKRSYQRACRRAVRDGMTYYRCKCLTRRTVLQNKQFADWDNQFRGSYRDGRATIVSKATSTSFTSEDHSTTKTSARYCGTKPVCRPGQVHRVPRLSCISWNVGGLSVGKLDNFLAWMEDNQFRLVTLQETRWNFDSEWQSGSFLLIHSGGTKGDSHCSVLVAIHTSLCPRQLVRHATIVPGRLLHVRMGHPTSSQSIDIINCYQYFLGKSQVDQEERVIKQGSLIDSLGKVLAGIPVRNHLVAGDFNMELPHHPPWTGASCSTTSSQTELQESLLQTVVSNGLCAINTWGPSTAYSCTGPKTLRVANLS